MISSDGTESCLCTIVPLRAFNPKDLWDGAYASFALVLNVDKWKKAGKKVNVYAFSFISASFKA